MSKELPPLVALRAFEAASRQLSFARAAEELHVTPAAVSHQVKQLEQWLKVKLFNRGANGVSLTPAGREYAIRVHDVFDLISRTTRSVRPVRQRAVVSMRSQFSFASMWLLPRLMVLRNIRPDIEISLAAIPEQYESKISADLQIHELACMAGYSPQPIMRGKFKVYAAPALLARCPKPTPARLLSQPLIHTSYMHRRLLYPDFTEWFRQAGVAAPAALPGMSFNLMHLTIDACILGAGFALLLDEYCLDSVRAGSLVAVPGPAIDSPHPFYLHTRNNASEDVQFVRDWLLGDANRG